MTSRPPVSGEPRTEAGRDLLQRCESGWKTWMDEPIRVNGMRRMILAIEAEASTGAKTVPALDVERLARAAANIRNAPLGPHWMQRTEELLAEYARLAEQEESA